jgi:hypothetical protein
MAYRVILALSSVAFGIGARRKEHVQENIVELQQQSEKRTPLFRGRQTIKAILHEPPRRFVIAQARDGRPEPLKNGFGWEG